MKLIYIVDFPISGNSGKNKATREKARALQEILGKSGFLFFHLPDNVVGLSKLMSRFLLDFRVFFSVLFLSGKYAVVQRVFFLPFSMLLFKIKGWKVFSEFHADFREEIPLLNKSKTQQRILKLISPVYDWNYHLSDGIIFNHPYLKSKFDPLFKKPSIYSYNGANVNDFIPEEQDIARKKLQIPADRTVFLFLGSVSQWHGVDYLIDTFNQGALKAKTDFFLYIVGAKENPFVRTLREKVENNNILFLPPVDNKTANTYINSADFCLLPVKEVRTSPGSPLKLYDYISCGKPVIAQKSVAGYSDEVENYGLGFTVDFTDADTASKVLLKIAENKNAEKFFHNRNMAKNELSWENRMKKWLDFINLKTK